MEKLEEKNPFKEILRRDVIKAINEAGFDAYFVGGCVRDQIYGVEPDDFDICTSATPEDLHKIFKDISNTSSVSEPFGVTMILIPVKMSIFDPSRSDIKAFQIEVATMRKDITKGRHPKVEFTSSIEEDAQRRDFTINALYENYDGEILDPTGKGLEDIKNNILRFVGDPIGRLTEDPLRAWRYVRFLATRDLNFSLDPKELEKLCKDLDYSDISTERRLKEFKKILAGKNYYNSNIDMFMASAKIWETLGFSNIFEKMLNVKQSFKWHAEGSEILFKSGSETEKSIDAISHIQDNSFVKLLSHGSVQDHTNKVFSEMFKQVWKVEDDWSLSTSIDDETRFLLMLSAILHDIGKIYSDLGMKHSEFEINGIKIVEDIPKVSDHDFIGAPKAYDFCKNLGLTNEESDFIAYMTFSHMKAHKIGEMKSLMKIWEFVTHPYFSWLILLARADERGSIKTIEDEWDGIDSSLEKSVFVPAIGCHVKIKELCRMKMPKPILTGETLISKGEIPGPLFKKKIEKAYEFQINDGINDVDILYNKVKNIILPKD